MGEGNPSDSIITGLFMVGWRIMTDIRKLRRLGANKSGETGGLSLNRDELRLEGIMNEDGELVERPNLVVDYHGNGKWTVELLEGSDFGTERAD